jgi:hypothetical protein
MPTPRRLRQEDCEFEASLIYTVRASLKKQTPKNTKKRERERLKQKVLNTLIMFVLPQGCRTLSNI